MFNLHSHTTFLLKWLFLKITQCLTQGNIGSNEEHCNDENDHCNAFAIHFKCCHWCTSSLIDSICMISTYLNVFNSHHYLFSIPQATIINESIAFLIQKLFELFYGKSISFRTLIFVLGMPMIKIYPCT